MRRVANAWRAWISRSCDHRPPVSGTEIRDWPRRGHGRGGAGLRVRGDGERRLAWARQHREFHRRSRSDRRRTRGPGVLPISQPLKPPRSIDDVRTASKLSRLRGARRSRRPIIHRHSALIAAGRPVGLGSECSFAISVLTKGGHLWRTQNVSATRRDLLMLRLFPLMRNANSQLTPRHIDSFFWGRRGSFSMGSRPIRPDARERKIEDIPGAGESGRFDGDVGLASGNQSSSGDTPPGSRAQMLLAAGRDASTPRVDSPRSAALESPTSGPLEVGDFHS